MAKAVIDKGASVTLICQIGSSLIIFCGLVIFCGLDNACVIVCVQTELWRGAVFVLICHEHPQPPFLPVSPWHKCPCCPARGSSQKPDDILYPWFLYFSSSTLNPSISPVDSFYKTRLEFPSSSANLCHLFLGSRHFFPAIFLSHLPRLLSI